MGKEIAIIGLGYVGLTTALSFARAGISVYGFEISKERVSSIQKGEVPFYEPGLSQLLKECLTRGLFTVGNTLTSSKIMFLTVGTPSDKDGNIDLSYVKGASRTLGEALQNSDQYDLVVVKSTVTPGTTENVVKPLIETASGKKFGSGLGLAVNPEFLREGSALRDMMHPDRLVIGEFDRKAGETLVKLYERFYGSDLPPILRTNTVNAEFIKYASNAFLAAKISFINTIANIAYNISGADVKIIAKGMGLDKRIGEGFLNAGVGYGGSCFPKDMRALINFSSKQGYEPGLLSKVDEVNNQQALEIVDCASEMTGGLQEKKIALLGLSFKPDTDDIREAPSLKIIQGLLDRGTETIAVHDPAAMNNVKQVFGNRLEYCLDVLETIKGADCCILATEWDVFRKLAPEDFLQLMRNPVLIDGRRLVRSLSLFQEDGV